MVEEVTEVDRQLGRARDFDVRPDGSWVGVFERPDGLHLVDSSGGETRLAQQLRFPLARAIGWDRVAVVDSRPLPNISGGVLLSLDGKLVRTFSTGDGVQDVVVLDDLVAVTYFDEGVFSGIPPGDQGIAFFNLDGEFFAGYQTLYGAEAVDVADCYAACRAGRHTLAFSPYAGFPLVRVNPRAHTQEVLGLPKNLQGASALSVLGDAVYFFVKQKLFAWRAGERPSEAGRYDGTLRGLENGRFLASGEHGFTILNVGAG
jgi:hypothetical protein